MKSPIYSSVSVLALLFAAPAIAQNNESDIAQTGNDNAAEVSQDGSNATSTVTQSSDDNIVEVNQSGDGASSLVEQTGDNSAYAFADPNNVAEVTQNGDSDSIVRQTGVAASANVYQDGDLNSSTIEQSGLLAITGRSDLGPLNYDATGVSQAGDNNRSFVEQRGGSSTVVIQDSSLAALGNQSDVMQGTGNGQAYVMQVGGNNDSWINQQTEACCGQPTPVATVNQMGDDHIASIDQTITSRGADATITQTGLSNDSYITQNAQGPVGSEGSVAATNQSGDNNYSLIDQQAELNDADVWQSGNSNFSYVYQNGTDNTADVAQHSDGNASTITQNGTGSTATVTQGGI